MVAQENKMMQSPGRKRWRKFKANRRGYFSLVIFTLLFCFSLFAELICNDRPLLVVYQDELYFPVFKIYPETTFGGVFETETDYGDPYFIELLSNEGDKVIFAPVRFSLNTINYAIDGQLPSPPTKRNILGTDDRGRDVFARLLYGFRLSVIFGLLLTAAGMVLGIIAGAIQGYFGGKTDILLQRLIEIWSSMPELYLLIIFASMFKPSVMLLFVLLTLFGWMGLADYVRAEFLKGRNLDYVKAAKALGVSDPIIMYRHLLPNSIVPVITFLPFRLSASILALTSLDFLGLGVPPSTPSLGELLAQGKANIDAWWISITTIAVLVGTLILLIFIGEGFREAFDPRKK